MTNDSNPPTIKDFLLARIAEDERIAQRMIDELEAQIEDGGLGGSDEKGPFTPTRMLSAQLWTYYDGQTRWRNFARGQYLARIGDPARVLRECAAKRAIIGMHRNNPSPFDEGLCAMCAETGANGQAYPCDTIKVLAAIYSDHPDYRQEWVA